jgi:hypothetical protein
MDTGSDKNNDGWENQEQEEEDVSHEITLLSLFFRDCPFWLRMSDLGEVPKKRFGRPAILGPTGLGL